MALRPGRCLLPQILKRAGLTQAELADRAGMSESTISHYVSKRRIMSLENAKNIADVLGVTIDELYQWEGISRRRGR